MSYQLRQSAVEEVQRRNFIGFFNPSINQDNPCLVLYVSRGNLVHDTISQIMKQGSCDFKKPLKVSFFPSNFVCVFLLWEGVFKSQCRMVCFR